MDNEREKQKKVLRSLVNQYGLSPSELKCLAEDFILELDSGVVLSLEELIKRSPKVVPGWFAFAGGKFSPNPNAYRNCQGVVGWVSPNPHAPVGRRGLIVTPDKVKKVFTPNNDGVAIDHDIRNPIDGKENTQNLIDYGRRHRIRFSAAEWCHSYSKNGVNPGEGFLPSLNQGLYVCSNWPIVSLSLEKLGKGLGELNQFWSSTETFHGQAYVVYGYESRGGGFDEDDDRCDRDELHDVRCFLAF